MGDIDGLARDFRAFIAVEGHRMEIEAVKGGGRGSIEMQESPANSTPLSGQIADHQIVASIAKPGPPQIGAPTVEPHEDGGLEMLGLQQGLHHANVMGGDMDHHHRLGRLQHRQKLEGCFII